MSRVTMPNDAYEDILNFGIVALAARLLERS